jgi:hypothetical protein
VTALTPVIAIVIHMVEAVAVIVAYGAATRPSDVFLRRRGRRTPTLMSLP